jgi:menaquinone-dependent protoporphyrinogen oxidase
MKKISRHKFLTVCGAAVGASVLACGGVAALLTRTPGIESIETSCGGENEMDKVLVAYASKYGATAEIAEKIGQVLCEAGLDTDVLPADRVGDLTPYKAVVLGSAVYIGMWQKKAATFLKANEKPLAERPVWLFSSGPTGEGDPVELTQGWRFPKSLQPVADRIRPRDIAVFHGNVDAEKLNFIERAVIRNVKAQFGDFRDWDVITAWATAIADALKEAGSAAGGSG